MSSPGAQTKRITHEENESNNTTQTTSNQQAAVDTTMLDMLKVISFHFPARKNKHLHLFKGRTKITAKRAPPTRRTRAAGAAAAAASSTNDTDDFFAPSTTTKTATSSTRSTPPATVPVVPPPAVTVSKIGLPDKPATIAAKSNKKTNSKEKKNFSLFDSDDSDIDELLFGSSKSMLGYFPYCSINLYFI